jgi:hypothetical protein
VPIPQSGGSFSGTDLDAQKDDSLLIPPRRTCLYLPFSRRHTPELLDCDSVLHEPCSSSVAQGKGSLACGPQRSLSGGFRINLATLWLSKRSILTSAELIPGRRSLLCLSWGLGGCCGWTRSGRILCGLSLPLNPLLYGCAKLLGVAQRTLLTKEALSLPADYGQCFRKVYVDLPPPM